MCDRHGSLTGIGGNRVFRAASGVQVLQTCPLASRGDLRAVPPGRYGRRPRSAAAPAGCGQAEMYHADDWLRPDRGVGLARIAGRARLSLKVARICTLPPPPPWGPSRLRNDVTRPPRARCTEALGRLTRIGRARVVGRRVLRPSRACTPSESPDRSGAGITESHFGVLQAARRGDYRVSGRSATYTHVENQTSTDRAR